MPQYDDWEFLDYLPETVDRKEQIQRLLVALQVPAARLLSVLYARRDQLEWEEGLARAKRFSYSKELLELSSNTFKPVSPEMFFIPKMKNVDFASLAAKAVPTSVINELAGQSEQMAKVLAQLSDMPELQQIGKDLKLIESQLIKNLANQKPDPIMFIAEKSPGEWVKHHFGHTIKTHKSGFAIFPTDE